MSKEIKISAIIACYNNSSDLIRCVDSLYNQGLMDDEFEVIIIDDGSTDDSGQIADNYTKTKSNVTVVHKKNEGVGVSRNLGLSLARGKYLHFIDGDDFVLSGSYRYIVDNCTKEDPDVMCFSYLRDANVNEEVSIGQCQVYSDIKEYIYNHYMPVMVWCKLFKRDYLIRNNIKWLPISYGEDFTLVWNAFRFDAKLLVDSSKIYSYNKTPDSLVTTRSVKRVKQTVRELIIANKEIANLYNYYPNISVIKQNFTHKYKYLFNRILCIPYSYTELKNIMSECAKIGTCHVIKSREVSAIDFIYHHPPLYFLFQKLIRWYYFKYQYKPTSVDFIDQKLS